MVVKVETVIVAASNAIATVVIAVENIAHVSESEPDEQMHSNDVLPIMQVFV